MHLPIDVLTAHWSPFVHLLVNVPRRFVLERPALKGIARQGTLAHVLFIIAAGRPRVSIPVTALPESRREILVELLASGELLPCTSERATACVAPVILLDAVRQLPEPLRDRLLGGDPASSVWTSWLETAPSPRPLLEVASDVIARAARGRNRTVLETFEALAEGLGLDGIGALVRGAGATTRSGAIRAAGDTVEIAGL